MMMMMMILKMMILKMMMPRGRKMMMLRIMITRMMTMWRRRTNRGTQFAQACAVEMHFDISEEPFYARICKENATL